MPQATIVSSWVEHGFACLAVAVNENGQRVEYVGRVPMDDAWQAMTLAQKKAALVAACRAARDASLAPQPVDLGVGAGVVSL